MAGTNGKMTCRLMHTMQGPDFSMGKGSKSIRDYWREDDLCEGRREVIGGFRLHRVMGHRRVTMARSNDHIMQECVLFAQGCVSR